MGKELTAQSTKELIQIQKDAKRSFADDPNSNKLSYGSLENVLIAFAKYNERVGYVQGMNFLAKTFLHHGSEVIAFWLIVILIEQYEMKEIYISGIL